MARLIVKVKTTAPRPQENDDTNTVVLMVGSTPQGDTGLKGDKGDNGDKGEQGEQGIQGIQGLKGDTGDPFIYTDFTSPQLEALKGVKGDTGARGLKGDKGDKGDKGASGNGAWGTITGNIADQLDLSELYYTKAEVNGTTLLLFEGLEHAALNGEYYGTTTTAHPNVNIAADGKLSRSIAIVATKDNAGNVAVASIQAGLDAPKIAYKKFFVPSGITSVEHGLDRDKILHIHGTYLTGSERISYASAKVDSTILTISQLSTYERTILITYEV